MSSPDEIIQERRNTHGPFAQQFAFAQMLKLQFRNSPNWSKLSAVQRETLEMWATKISRILNGDPNEPDHYDDVAGYARLVVMDLRGISDQRDAEVTEEIRSWGTFPTSDESIHARADGDGDLHPDAPRMPHVLDATIYDQPIGPVKPLQRPVLRPIPNKEDYDPLGINSRGPLPLSPAQQAELEKEVARELGQAN